MMQNEPLRLSVQQQAVHALLRALAESEAAGPMGDALSLLVQKELESCELTDEELDFVAAGQKLAPPPLHLPDFKK